MSNQIEITCSVTAAKAYGVDLKEPVVLRGPIHKMLDRTARTNALRKVAEIQANIKNFSDLPIGSVEREQIREKLNNDLRNHHVRCSHLAAGVGLRVLKSQ